MKNFDFRRLVNNSWSSLHNYSLQCYTRSVEYPEDFERAEVNLDVEKPSATHLKVSLVQIALHRAHTHLIYTKR